MPLFKDFRYLHINIGYWILTTLEIIATKCDLLNFNQMAGDEEESLQVEHSAYSFQINFAI